MMIMMMIRDCIVEYRGRVVVGGRRGRRRGRRRFLRKSMWGFSKVNIGRIEVSILMIIVRWGEGGMMGQFFVLRLMIVFGNVGIVRIVNWLH